MVPTIVNLHCFSKQEVNLHWKQDEMNIQTFSNTMEHW